MTLTPQEANVLRSLKQEPCPTNLFKAVMPSLIAKGLARLGRYRTDFYYPTEEGMSLDV